MRANYLVAALFVMGCGSSPSGNPHGDLISIEVEPANATLVYTGPSTTLDYTAIGHYEDGTIAAIPDATFSLDANGSVLGAMTSAQFAASGQAAGKGGVVAQVDDVVGATSVIVIVHPVHIGPGVPADGADSFPDISPTGALSPAIVYPLDGAVMPSSVRAPDVQWDGVRGASDLYRVRLTAGYATVDTILAGSPTFTLNATPTPADWRLLVNSAGAGMITVAVDHWDPMNGAHAGAPVAIRMVNANITGAIYYWNLDAGRMERLDDMGRALAIANPPPRPGDSLRCVACHTVSKDGRYLASALWDAGQQGGVFDLSDPAVRTGDPAPTISPVTGTSYTTLFSTFNADASRLLVNVETSLRLIDPRTGMPVPTAGTPLPSANAAHPTWSPDGSTIAFINNITNGGPATWAVDYTVGDLQLISATAGDTFGPPSQLVASASVDPAFSAPSWPSFSPDSAWIAYGAGVNSRGRNGPTTYPGSLFVVDKAGGAPRALDIACGGARACYLPNFSPYDAGGYFWLVFYSFRDYGNAPAGTKGTGRRQLWVTAIDKSKLASGGDPSAVPYWVPDQDRQTQNMSAFWALPPPIN